MLALLITLALADSGDGFAILETPAGTPYLSPPESFHPWATRVMQAVTDAGATAPVALEATACADPAESRVVVAGVDEKPPRKVVKALHAAVAPWPEVKRGCVAMLFTARTGLDVGSRLVPPIPGWNATIRDGLGAMPIADHDAAVRTHLRTVTLPTLADEFDGVDPAYAGLRATAAAIRELRGEEGDAERLARQPATWRAMFETTPGESAVVVTFASLLYASGLPDRGTELEMIARAFASPDSLGVQLLDEMGPWTDSLRDRQNAVMKEAIDAFDARDPATTERLMTSIADGASCRAGAWHERFLAQGYPEADWPRVRAAILHCDPLYYPLALAVGPEQVRDVKSRLELAALRERGLQSFDDLLAYGTLAYDLGDPIVTGCLGALAIWQATTPEDTARAVAMMIAGAEAAGAEGTAADLVKPGSEADLAIEAFHAEAAARRAAP